MASTLPSHRSRRCESSCRSSQPIESYSSTLDWTRNRIRIRTSPAAALRREGLVDLAMYSNTGTLTHLNNVLASPITITPGVQSSNNPPSLSDQQLTCPPEQSLKGNSFALGQIASPLAQQSQRIIFTFEQRSKLEKHPAARKTIDSICIIPLLPPPPSSFLDIHDIRQQQQHVEKTLSLPFPSLISFSYLFLSSSSVSAGQKPPRVYYHYSLRTTHYALVFQTLT